MAVAAADYPASYANAFDTIIITIVVTHIVDGWMAA